MIEVRPFETSSAEDWDELVMRAPMGTFLHSRRFLSYHGERFTDASLRLLDGPRLAGVLPAALDPADPRRVSSHPGVTFGGVVHDGQLTGERMVEALAAIALHYAERGLDALRYKSVPHIYHRVPAMDDSYALFQHGARLAAFDLSCAIDLDERRTPSERRRRGRKRATAKGVEIAEGAQLAERFWPVLEESLRSRFGTQPVHDLGEISLLAERFPEQIRFVVATLSGRVVAGVVLFTSPRVFHAQYIAASPEGRDASALDVVFEHCIDAAAAAAGTRYFDFGTSSVPGRQELNAGVFRFKAEFGGGGVAHLTYDLPFRPAES